MLNVAGLIIGVFGVIGFFKGWAESRQKRMLVDEVIARDKAGVKVYPEEYTYAAGLADELGLIHTSMALRKKRGLLNG